MARTAGMIELTPTERFRMRWKRRRLLFRAWRSRNDLTEVRRRPLPPPDRGPVAFGVVRNEIGRLPWFLEHYRERGVTRFCLVDNASSDGTTRFLADQPDVDLWTTAASYRASRFGVDWTNWLLFLMGAGRWCLVVDADELLTYDGDDRHDLVDLTRMLDARRQPAFGALMLDLYPRHALGTPDPQGHGDPLRILTHFDPAPYRAVRQRPMGNLWVQGGMRERVFFADAPRRSPTLNKLPLVRWNRSFAYANSTHSLLPPRLNALYDGPGDPRPSGVLLHTKFLPEIVDKARTEKARAEHFHTPALFDAYYDAIAEGPVVHGHMSRELRSNSDLVDAGLMPRIRWRTEPDPQSD